MATARILLEVIGNEFVSSAAHDKHVRAAILKKYADVSGWSVFFR